MDTIRRYPSATTDGYHIELERSESTSNLPQGKYIERSISTMTYKKDRETKISVLFCVYDIFSSSLTALFAADASCLKGSLFLFGFGNDGRDGRGLFIVVKRNHDNVRLIDERALAV